ncbi:MAG: DUF362 domain-containing protein [Planctomycetes bacterium]|nr:DUF362 domain-containing protein [Planctomycetota bacterium]
MKNKKTSISRRDFLKNALIIGGAGLMAPSLFPILSHGEDDKKKKEDEKEVPIEKILAICSTESDKTNPGVMVKEALALLGGMKKFVKKGDVVLVKPNIAWERKPEFAATTNPKVVAAVIEEALAAGAKKVKVFDRTCNDARRCYKITEIEEVAKKAGAEVFIIEKDASFYQEVKIPKGKILKSCDVVKEVLESNVFINVPIAKHHGISRLTLGIKNLMGVVGGNRGELHKEIGTKLTDILSVTKPHLNIMDAFNVLVAHGPIGGDLKDVRFCGKIIAGVDIVAVDSYTAGLKPFSEGSKKELTWEDIPYIKEAAERGLGEADITKLKILEKKV